MKRLCCVLACLIICQLVMATRPKIGLALGGGGAKGAATIGVLRTIEEAGIKVDYIAGTSIGALIGGLYSAGSSIDEIEEFVFSQEIPSIIDSYQFERMLDKRLIKHKCELMEYTRIPFRCTATNSEEMKEIILSKGSLSKAIVASMSVPIAFEPMRINRMDLYDGGLLNNLPVDVVKAMGADIIIAIDLQQNEDDGLQIPSLGLGGIFDIVAEWSAKRPDKRKYKENVKAADIYIHPSLTGYNAASFGRSNCEVMKRKGIEAAKQHLHELIKLK